MLEAIHYETFDRDAPEYFIVVDHQLLYRVQALYLRQQDERVEVIVGEDELPQLREPPQLVQVRMEDYKVEPDVVQVDFLDLPVELGPLEHFKRVTIDVKNLI